LTHTKTNKTPFLGNPNNLITNHSYHTTNSQNQLLPQFWTAALEKRLKIFKISDEAGEYEVKTKV